MKTIRRLLAAVALLQLGACGTEVKTMADTEHPQRLATGGGWQQPTVFVRNSMCALTAAHINTTPETLLKTMLLPQVRVGTSTPKSDPSGDYA